MFSKKHKIPFAKPYFCTPGGLFLSHSAPSVLNSSLGSPRGAFSSPFRIKKLVSFQENNIFSTKPYDNDEHHQTTAPDNNSTEQSVSVVSTTQQAAAEAQPTTQHHPANVIIADVSLLRTSGSPLRYIGCIPLPQVLCVASSGLCAK